MSSRSSGSSASSGSTRSAVVWGTIIWTDVLQTVCLVLTLGLIVYVVSGQLGLNLSGIVRLVGEDPHSRVFFFDDWTSPQYFWKQFVSGIFIVIVMTGLDQNMMQKNLTCRTLREARTNMLTYGFGFLPLELSLPRLGDSPPALRRSA